MTWKQIEAWAERNEMVLGCDEFGGVAADYFWAYVELVGHPAQVLEVAAGSPSAAKRALCRAVQRIREAK